MLNQAEFCLAKVLLRVALQRSLMTLMLRCWLQLQQAGGKITMRTSYNTHSHRMQIIHTSVRCVGYTRGVAACICFPSPAFSVADAQP